MSRVVLLGAAGMLGHDLAATVPQGIELHSLTRADVDVTDPAALARIIDEVRPAVILNATAYTDVDKAETDGETAVRVNGEAPGIIGAAAAARGACVVHYSTDYVFNASAGRPVTEDHPTAPLNAYGASKLAGEQALQASGAPHIIIRTQWLFGKNGRSFPRTMWERATRRQKTRVVNDQFGRATYTRDLATASWALLPAGDRPARSLVLHVANPGVISWYDIAHHVFVVAGAPDLLEPCTSAEFPRPARRPAWSALDTSRFDTLVAPLPPWQGALDRFLAEIRDE